MDLSSKNRIIGRAFSKISLSKKSKITLVLRVMIISFCCLFFSFGAIVDRGLEEIEINSFLNNKFLSNDNSETFEYFVNYTTIILGSYQAIGVYINIIYLVVHPFMGLKLILVCTLSQYLIVILQVLYESHRPSWDSVNIKSIVCRNTFPNPSLYLFYSAFFYLYLFINFNMFKKKKFTSKQKIIIMVIYLIYLGINFLLYIVDFFLYYHQIVYTLILSLVVIVILIDYETRIYNFIFNSLKNLYNTRVYKMKIFYLVSGLFTFGYLGLFFIEDSEDLSTVRMNIIKKDDKECIKGIKTLGKKESILYTSFLGALVGAFWGASFTVEKKVGKWWSKKSRKKSFIKIICILFICGIFITLDILMEELKNRYELLFVLKIILNYFESYCIFGLMPLFFQKIGYNDDYISQSYEKINLKLTNEDDVQLFRKSIFINENKGKKDVFVVLDREEKNKKDDKNENKNLKEDENIINLKPEKDSINNDIKEDISFEKKEENKKNQKDIEPKSMIIKNLVEMGEDEGDYEFDIENEKLNKSLGSIDKLKEDLINTNEEE